jgi:3-oxoacyl-[acyl-carrier protein] reductase
MNLPGFRGKCVLITGASSGIGAASAILFAKNGCTVGIHYNKNKAGANTILKDVKKLGSGYMLHADLRNTEDIPALIEDFVNNTGRLDILVNNAGSMIKRQSIANANVEYYDSLYQINVRHVFLLSRAALPHLKKSRGNIINIGSISGHTGGFTGSGVYATMKSAVATATVAMAKEFAPDGIRVNSVLPGFIDTPFHDEITSDEQRQQFLDKTPLGRFGTAEDIAHAILFLASDTASFITGEYLAVNGGMHMRV